jgi:hypothetical protein
LQGVFGTVSGAEIHPPHVARRPRALVHLPQGLKSGDVAIAPRLALFCLKMLLVEA